MFNLLVEIGNTALKAAWSDGMTLGKTFRYQGERRIEFIESLTAKEKPDILAVASVYEISATEEKRLRGRCTRLLLLDSAHPELLKKYSLPQFLSYDRAASVIAARYLFKGRGCTVFDFGTTMSVDFTDASGTYLGGDIALGCRTRFKAVNRYSKSLPLVDIPEEAGVAGTSVRSSIENGVVSGIMFEIEGWTKTHPENVVIFTGGDAIYFAKRMKNSIFVICNLVLMGLALMAYEYEVV